MCTNTHRHTHTYVHTHTHTHTCTHTRTRTHTHTHTHTHTRHWSYEGGSWYTTFPTSQHTSNNATLSPVLGPTHTGGRHATCAYWADYTQAHVVQWWPCTSIPMMSSLNRRSHMTEPFSATAYLGIRLSFRWHQGAETHVGYHATSPQLF